MTDAIDTAFAITSAEYVLCLIATDGGHLLITKDRIAVSHGHRVTMDLPIGALRRIQLDIERNRPATFVIVPDSPQTEPAVVPIPVPDYDVLTAACAHIGRLLEGLD